MSRLIKSSRRHLAPLVLMLASLYSTPAAAQVRERAIAFDSAGRITTITPPLAARLGLVSPLWPASGDYLDARIFAIEDAARSFVLVVRRPREIFERHPVDSARRAEIGAAIDRANALLLAATGLGADSMPMMISEPVRGAFVASQTLLAAGLFGPAAATIVSEPAASAATYLAVTGGMFFYAANLTRESTVSRAQNHLAAHSAVRGAAAGRLALFALAGESGTTGKAQGTALLAGGLLGDVIGFRLAAPMTDAEAHGTSHGSTVSALITGGLLETLGGFKSEGASRISSGVLIAGGAIGYPIGLRYVREAPYRVTAGDVGTMLIPELLTTAAVGTFLVDNKVNERVVAALLTGGFIAGAMMGDHLLVRPYDHTESEARLLGYGTAAGALLGLAGPVLADTRSPTALLALMTLGGTAGAIMTERLIEPARAATGTRRGSIDTEKKVGGASLHLNPGSLLLAGLKQPGNHSLVSLEF